MKDIYAAVAEQDGKVISLNNKGIIVQYDDKSTKGVKLGRTYGNSEGAVYPHDVVTQLKLNEKFKAGDAIAYNTAFFEPDFFNKKQVVWKSSMTAKTVVWDAAETLEDSSSLSLKLAKKLSNKTTKVRSIVIEFTQNLRKVFPVGSEIKLDDILCYIEDEVTAGAGTFNDESIETLKALANKSPKAKYSGMLDKIEVIYHGEKRDMSPTLKKLANASDKELADSLIAQGKEPYTNLVDFNYRVDGNPLLLDTAEIKFYITIDHPSSVGDKGVFSHQLKTVFGETYTEMYSEDGDEIEAVFGATPIANRIVRSADIIGTTTTLLNKIAKLAVKTYRGN